MAIAQIPFYSQVPNFRFLIPDFTFLTAERIHRAATATLEGGLLIAGFVQGGLAIADVANNRTLPAIAHGGTSALCFWSYSTIKEFKEKIAQLETMRDQLERFQTTNQELRDSISQFNTLFESFTSNSTDLTQLKDQIQESVTKLEAVASGHGLTVVQNLVSQIQNLFAEDRGKALLETKRELEEVTRTLLAAKEQLVNTSQNIETQMSTLTQQYNDVEIKRSQLEFLTGLVPRVLAIAESSMIYPDLEAADQRRIFELRQFYTRTIIPLNNPLGQPR